MSKESKPLYEFGPFRLDPNQRILLRDQQPISLQPKAFDILLVLIEHSPNVVGKDDLLKSVWPDSFVEESNLSQNIFVLRKALGDKGGEQRYIVTLPGRGYRFAAEVREMPARETEVKMESNAGSQAIIDQTGNNKPMHPAASMVAVLGTKPWKWIVGVTLALLLLVITGAVRMRRQPGLKEADLVLVSDFVNTTGEPIFDGTLKQALTVKLAESPYFDLVPDSQTRKTLTLMGRSPDERVVPPIAREVCQREGAKVVVGGSILVIGDKYVIDVDATNCLTGARLVRQEMETSDREHVLNALGQTILPLRRKLGESLASIERLDTPIEQATTKSLPALKAYATAEEKRARGQDPESVQFYQIAINLDPDFALAFARLGTVYHNMYQQTLAEECWRKATERSNRVTDREKFYIIAHATKETDKLIETYKVWAEVYPHDWTPFNNLASQYALIGLLDQSVDAAQQALRLNPNQAFAYEGLARGYACCSRFAEARVICEKAKEKKLDGWRIHQLLWKFAFIDGDGPGMMRELDWQKGQKMEGTMLFFEGEQFLSVGQLGRSREVVERGRGIALKRALAEPAADMTATQAMREAEVGSFQGTQKWTDAALHQTDAFNIRSLAIIALALSGDLRRAENLAKQLHPTEGDRYQAIIMTWLHAVIDLGRHRPADAITELQQVLPYDWSLAGAPIYYRALAYLDLESGRDAATQFQKILDNRGAAYFYWPVAHLGLARAYALSGDREGSLAAYRTFLELWKDADPDLRLLKEAQAEYARLGRSRAD